jgi:hypothetical protein
MLVRNAWLVSVFEVVLGREGPAGLDVVSARQSGPRNSEESGSTDNNHLSYSGSIFEGTKKIAMSRADTSPENKIIVQ